MNKNLKDEIGALKSLISLEKVKKDFIKSNPQEKDKENEKGKPPRSNAPIKRQLSGIPKNPIKVMDSRYSHANFAKSAVKSKGK